jgi:putative endonuclease
MFFVYILHSLQDDSYYFGMTADPENRLHRHNCKYEKYTSKRGPWKMVWCLPIPTRKEALALEKKLKNLKSRKRIRQFIEKYS